MEYDLVRESVKPPVKEVVLTLTVAEFRSILWTIGKTTGNDVYPVYKKLVEIDKEICK